MSTFINLSGYFRRGVNFAIFSQTVRVGSNFAKIGKSKIINFTISALSLAIQIKASNILEILIKKIKREYPGRIIDNVDFFFHEQSHAHFIFINSHVWILFFINSRLTIFNW